MVPLPGTRTCRDARSRLARGRPGVIRASQGRAGGRIVARGALRGLIRTSAARATIGDVTMM